MTVFIKAAKLLILECLDESMAEANAKDQGYLGGFRDIELSKEQNRLTLELRQKIQSIELKGPDSESLAVLKKLITDADTQVENTRKEKKYSRGHLNATLITINSNLERFYTTISNLRFKPNSSDSLLTFNLNDIEDSKYPYNVLCSHAAYYFGENIFSPTDEGLILKTVSSFVGATAFVTVRAQKENCLLTHLHECSKELGSIKESKEHDDMREKVVRQAIKNIQEGNATICKAAQPIPTLPISISFFATATVKAPTVKPSRGRLETCMQHVLDELNSLKEPHMDEAFAFQ